MPKKGANGTKLMPQKKTEGGYAGQKMKIKTENRKKTPPGEKLPQAKFLSGENYFFCCGIHYEILYMLATLFSGK